MPILKKLLKTVLAKKEGDDQDTDGEEEQTQQIDGFGQVTLF